MSIYDIWNHSTQSCSAIILELTKEIKIMVVPVVTNRAIEIGSKVEAFVREKIVPFEIDPRRDRHGCPTHELADELRGIARDAGLLTPHILDNGSHLNQIETAYVLIRSGLSPLGPLALHVGAPDEGNMYLLGKVGSTDIKERF